MPQSDFPYEVDPGNVANIWPTDANDRRYQQGVQALTRITGRLVTPGDPPPISENLYQREPDTTTPEQEYSDLTVQTALVGPVGQVSSYVQETHAWTYWAIEDIQEAKILELADIVQAVLAQGVVVTGVGDLQSTPEYRDRYAAQQLCTLPDATIGRTPDLWGDWLDLTKAQCRDVHTSLFLLDAQTLGQAEVHEDEVNRLTLAGDPAALAAYDVTSGFPAAPTPPTEAQTRRQRNGHVRRTFGRFVTTP